MKKIFTTILMALVSMGTWAYDVEVDGIYYNLVSKAKTAEVTFKGATFNEIASYTGSVTIPEKITVGADDYSVTTIGPDAFYKCIGLTSVAFGSSVTSIASDAFYGCTNLTSVEMGNSITSIGYCAFSGCTGLKSINIPSSVTSIEYLAFSNCAGLTSVNISDLASWCKITFTSQESNPLYNAHHLYLNGEEITDLQIPNSVTSIGGNSFNNCTELKTVKIPSSVLTIGTGAFRNCSNITYMVIPNSVESLGNVVFENCTGLTSITIPSSVANIGDYAFYGCTALTAVYISDISSWCNIDFGGAWANPLSYAHSLYLNGEELKNLEIPSSVTNIGYATFRGCSSLTSVNVGNSVKSVGAIAFSGCTGMTSLTLGNSIGSLDRWAFDGCKNIETVICTSMDVPSMGDDVFKDCLVNYSTLEVPNASINLYKSADQWKDFGTIKGIGETAIENVRVADNKKDSSEFYGINGMQNNSLQKGLNIIKTQDGVKKVLVK